VRIRTGKKYLWGELYKLNDILFIFQFVMGQYFDQGDRGGPIIVKGVLVGTASWAYGCANPDYAGIYTRITTYVAWIKTTMANNVG
jgi:hypothetical protein